MPDIVRALPTDANNRRFAGPEGYLPKGTRVGSTDYAVAHVLLVDASNNALVVASDLDSGAGTANRMGVALLVPASGGPAVVPGDGTNGLATQVMEHTPGTAAANLGKAEDAAHGSGDTGVMSLFVRADVPTSLAANGNGRYTPPEVDPLNSVWVRQQTVGTSTDVSQASSASSAQLLAANTSRRGLLLTNTDANDVYLYYGTTATAAKFTVKIPPGGYWEMPVPVYSGRIDCIWSADGSGSLIGSEL